MNDNELGDLLRRVVSDEADMDGVPWYRVAHRVRDAFDVPAAIDDEEFGEIISDANFVAARRAMDSCHEDWERVARDVRARLVEFETALVREARA